MRIRALIVGAVFAAIAAPAVLAATPGAGLLGYGGQGGTVQGQLGAEGTLPFTGYDLALVAVGAALLLAVGFVLRRAARANA